MIPSDPKEIAQLEKLAKRNIANGDWGDEVTIPGLPGETTMPMSPEERQVKGTVSHILSNLGRRRLPKHK